MSTEMRKAREKMSFSNLLCKTQDVQVENGELAGTCCVCGNYTHQGHKTKFGANFTSANLINNSGDVICPTCKYCVKNSNSLRRTMFLLTEDEFLTFKKQDIKDIIFNLPKKQFYLYLTKTWQKIGWILMNEAYNDGETDIIKVVIDYDVITVDLNTLKKYYVFVRELRDCKISKPSLENGELTPFQFNQLVELKNREYARKVTKKIKQLKNNQEYNLAVYIVD